MGGASKGVSIITTLILVILSLQIWNRLVNTAEYQIEQLFGNIFAFLQGTTPLDEPMLMTIIIIVLGVISIIGAARG